MAPTTSFWDCGEFITASYTLGVPHPPGAPFYLLLGRLFSLLPIASDIGLRVNIISSLVSAITVMLLYLCIVRLGRVWRGREKTVAEKIALYGSAMTGAFCFAFSHSFWFNAVEAEVYSMSMFFTAIIFYMGLRWLDHADDPFGNRILLLIFYIIGLSSGVHLLNVLALISVALIVGFHRYGGSVRVFIVSGLVGTGVILSIYPGIVQGLPMLIKQFSIWSVLALLVMLIWLATFLLRRGHRRSTFAVISILLVVLGYSTFLLIKIRSGLNPFLDENDPETWGRLLSYLNREQYGSDSLFLTIFDRKAPFWTYQIKKMYLRYLGWQYLDLQLFYGIPFLIGVIGAFQQFYRDSKNGMIVLALFIMTGLAVVMYLNQDDPQPRERDYAYVGSYFAFAIWIGIGALSLIDTVVQRFKAVSPTIPVVVIAGLILIAAPFNMLAKNYKSHSRHGNYVAWDYSYNLLMTCAPNAILYTNGDNDTFPVWYLQEVAGIRKDVRVANLSLLNTGWFIKQIRDKYPKTPMPSRINDDYIDNVIDSRDVASLMDRKWPESQKVRIKGPNADGPDLIWDVPSTLSYPFPGGQTEHFLRVQDFMILNTLVASKWERPIYFAVTVSDANLLGLRDIRDPSKNFLSMEGLAFRLHPEPVPLIDHELLAKNMMQVYRYRNTSNPDIHYDDNVLKLLGNYRQGLIQLAFNHLAEAEGGGISGLGAQPLSSDELAMPMAARIENYEALSPRLKALTALDFMESIVPPEVVPINHEIVSLQIGRLYAQLGKQEELVSRLDKMVSQSGLAPDRAFQFGIYYLTEADAPDRAKVLFDRSLEADNSFNNHQRVAYTWMQYAGDTAVAADVFRKYLDHDEGRQAKLRVAAQAVTLGLHGLAFSIYDPLLQHNPDDGEAVRGMVDYHRATGDIDYGLALAEDWLQQHPEDKSMISRRDQLKKSAGDALP